MIKALKWMLIYKLVGWVMYLLPRDETGNMWMVGIGAILQQDMKDRGLELD